MRVGIGLWCLQSSAIAPRPFPRLYRELIDDALLAERVGLDSLWLSEHHAFYDGYCPALLPTAAAALTATTRLGIGTGVLLLPLQEPERVAAAAAEVHRLSGGRLELGMGMGYRPSEFEAKGREIGDRVRLMNDGLDVLVRQLDDGGPRLWVGVTSVAAARRAGRRGLGLLISGAFAGPVVDELIEAHRQAWSSVGEPGGSAPPVGLLRNVWLCDGPGERRRALDWVRSSYLVYAGLGWSAAGSGVDFAVAVESSMDEVEASAVVGSVEEVAARLGAHADVELIVCRIGYDAPPRAALVEMIERVGTELRPALEGTT